MIYRVSVNFDATNPSTWWEALRNLLPTLPPALRSRIAPLVNSLKFSILLTEDYYEQFLCSVQVLPDFRSLGDPECPIETEAHICASTWDEDSRMGGRID